MATLSEIEASFGMSPTLTCSIITERRLRHGHEEPPHPGLTVRHDWLEPLGLSVTQGAKVLGVTRQALNDLLNGKSGISHEMAVRLAEAFGSSAETWLGIQLDYDLAQVRRRESEIHMRRVKKPAHAEPHHV